MTSPLPSPRQQPTAPRGGRRWAPARLALAALALAAAAYCPGPHQIPLAAAGEDHDIEKGEVDRFAAHLDAGDFLRVFVEESGVDVELRLLDPEGAELAHVDGIHDRHYPEELAAVAERSGRHVLRIRALSDSPGGYRLKLAPRRPATAADRLRAEAVRATQAACDAIRRHPTQEDLARQLALRQASLRLWRRTGDPACEAEALFQLGAVQYRRGELAASAASYRASAESYRRAAEIWGSLGKLARQADAHRQAGAAYRDAGLLEKARGHFELARALAARAGAPRVEAAALNSLGRLDLDAGDAVAALVHLRRALPLAAGHGLADQEVSILSNLAGAYEILAQPQDALKCFNRSLEIAEGDAATFNNLGLFYQGLGDWDLAVQHFRRALELRLPGNLRARTLNNLGLTLWTGDKPRQALAPLEEALRLAEQRGEQEVQVRAAINLAYVRLDLKDPDAAQVMGQRALAAAAGRQDLLTETHALLAKIYLARGQVAAARAEMDRTLALVRQRKHVSWMANLTTSLLLAQLERATGARESALDRVRRAISTVESVRGRVVDPDLRATLLASRQSLYEMEIGLLMELGGEARRAEALKASERVHARSLLDMLSQAGANVRKGADAKLIVRQQRLLQEVRLLENRRLDLLREGAPENEVAEAERRLTAELAKYERAEDEMVSSSPRYRSLAQPDLLDVGEIQGGLLDRDDMLLEYSLGEEHSYLWAVTPDAVHTFKLLSRKEIDKAARDFYELLTARNEPPDEETPAARRARVERADESALSAAAHLGELVLGPAADLFAGRRRLLIVPDGALHYVPFQALAVAAAPGGLPAPLVERHEVVILPSASAIAALRDEVRGRPPPPEILAMIADPVFEADDERFDGDDSAASKPGGQRRGPTGRKRQEGVTFERLDHSGEEAKAIAALVPEEHSLIATGFDATLTKVLRGDLARYRYVHFATHGVIDTQRPDLSRLELSQLDRNGKRQNGSLLLADIYNLELNADLVVLSACETALGREIRGEGLVGLTRGFMYAGAPRVVASLWSVDDQATGHLMESFYQGMLERGLPPATALREAQLEVRKTWASPYYWAGFSLQGEWK